MTLAPRRFTRIVPVTTAAAAIILASGCSSSKPPVREKAEGLPPVSSYAVLDNEKVDVPDIKLGNVRTVREIINEGKNNNQVMEHLSYLCADIGPRLTASSNLEEANRWVASQFEAWGLENVENQVWGHAQIRFDRGPSTGAVLSRSGEDDETFETEREIEFTTLSWAPGTDGPTRGKVVRMPETLDDFEAVKDDLDGAWILVSPYQGGRQGIRGVGGSMTARHQQRNEMRARIDAGEMPEMPSTSPYPNDAVSGIWEGTLEGPAIPSGKTDLVIDVAMNDEGAPNGTISMPEFGYTTDLEQAAFDDGMLTFTWATPEGPQPMTLAPTANEIESSFDVGEDVYTVTLEREPVEEQPADPSEYILAQVLSAGPAGFISSSRDERVWTTSVKRGMDLIENLTMDDIGRDVEVSVRDSDYRYLNSDLADGQDVWVEFDLDHTITQGPFELYNTIGEIPGTRFPDEVVIVSAHLDSWNGPGSQGVVDNGTGSAVTMEAARLLMAAGAKPERTIRFILWTGEEQGLLGSRAYVEGLSEEERAKISCVFVDDGGTNYEGGLVCPPWMFDYLAGATSPINGKFLSEIDRDRMLSDDNPDNDERAGFMDVNLRTVESMPQGGGSDHASFNRVGIPGFYWDEVGRANYRYGWHTQNDRLDLAIEEYLVQSATTAAVTAYNLACAPTLLPREDASVAESATASAE